MPLDTLAMSPQVVTVGVDACVFSSPAPHVSTKLVEASSVHDKLLFIDKASIFPIRWKKYNPQVQKFSNTTNIQIKLKTSMFSPQDDRTLSFLADHTSEVVKSHKHPHWQEGVTSAIGNCPVTVSLGLMASWWARKQCVYSRSPGGLT